MAACSEEYICNTLANLKVLSSVPNGGRLCVRKGQLAVDTTVNGQCIVRFMYGDSRETSLNHIKNTITSSISVVKALMADPRTTETWEHMWTLERMAAEMERCSSGIRNLKATYCEDLSMAANLDVQEERLQAHCAELRRFLMGGTPPMTPRA
jgi:hypothetical protein